jgi:hypothetical protein
VTEEDNDRGRLSQRAARWGGRDEKWARGRWNRLVMREDGDADWGGLEQAESVVSLNPPTGVDRQHESREARSLYPLALQITRVLRLEFVGHAT